MMGGISEEGVLWLENQMKRELPNYAPNSQLMESILVFHVSRKTSIAAAIAIWFL